MTAATDKVMDDLEDFEESMDERIDDLRERAEEIDVTIRRAVREHPFLSLAGAVTAGYLLGRLIARR